MSEPMIFANLLHLSYNMWGDWENPKVKGRFFLPGQGGRGGERQFPLGRLRLVVMRQGEADAMTLRAETAAASDALREEIAGTLRAVTKLGGNVELVSPGALPNDGKVIADER